MARKYDLKRRAERQEATRRRIVEVTVALHESVGVAATTITEIAERAGVGRLTVYRHFPDQQALLTACTSHYYEQHPSPDPASWQDMSDPTERLGRALASVYVYFGETEGMLTRAEQGAPSIPVLAELMVPRAVLWAGMCDGLAAAWADDPSSPVAVVRRAAIGHALAFSTWRSLTRDQGLTDRLAIDLMLATVRCTVWTSRHPACPEPRLGAAPLAGVVIGVAAGVGAAVGVGAR